MNFSDEYRFGISIEIIKKELDHHSPIIRSGCYVPTAKEVHSLSPDQLLPILEDWLWESPTLIIPSNKQIEEVLSVIKERPDAMNCSNLLDLCLDYIGDSDS